VKTLIVYHSMHHQNTKMIAEVMAKILQADLVEVDKVDENTIANYDLIGFGSGIYFWKHHQTLINLVKQLAKVSGIKAFVFSTSGKDNSDLKYKFHNLLKNELKIKGFELVSEFNCPGFDTWGPFKIIGGFNKGRPNDFDLHRAEEFAKKLII
jgi:flavodoxin